MHRQDYKIIAKALNHTRPWGEHAELQHIEQWELDRRAISNLLESNFENFSSSLFYEACEGGF